MLRKKAVKATSRKKVRRNVEIFEQLKIQSIMRMHHHECVALCFVKILQ